MLLQWQRHRQQENTNIKNKSQNWTSTLHINFPIKILSYWGIYLDSYVLHLRLLQKRENCKRICDRKKSSRFGFSKISRVTFILPLTHFAFFATLFRKDFSSLPLEKLLRKFVLELRQKGRLPRVVSKMQTGTSGLLRFHSSSYVPKFRCPFLWNGQVLGFSVSMPENIIQSQSVPTKVSFEISVIFGPFLGDPCILRHF